MADSLKINPVTGLPDLVGTSGGGGGGDVTGPASSVDNSIVVFDGTTGKVIKDPAIATLELSGTLINQNWDDNQPSLILDGTTADALNTFSTGIIHKGNGSQSWFTIFTEDQSGAAKSSDFWWSTGYNSGSGGTGSIYFASGDKDNAIGNSGNLTIKSGNVNTGGNSGSISLQSGSAAGISGSVTIGSNSAGGNSGGLNLSTGSSSANSGDIQILTGSAAGTRGKIKLIDGSQGTVGHVWTQTNADGSGAWQVAGGGGANTALSNLASVAINTSLLPNSDNTLSIGSNTLKWVNVHSYTYSLANNGIIQARNAANSADVTLFQFDTSDQLRINRTLLPTANQTFNLGSSTLRFDQVFTNTVNSGSTSLSITGNGTVNFNGSTINQTGSINPNANNSFDIGTSSLNYSNLHLSSNLSLKSTALQASLNLTGQISALPSGSTSSPGLSNVSTSATSGFRNIAIFTNNNATADANPSGTIRIETGNRTAGTGASGDIALQTGTSSGGTRGKIDLKADDIRFTDNLSIKFTESSANWWTTSSPGLEFTSLIGIDYVVSSSNLSANIATSPIGLVTGSNTGVATSGSTGDAFIVTGQISDPGSSGSTGGIVLYTGDNAGLQKSGDIEVYSGVANSGNSGRFAFETGDSTSGNSGEIRLRTGAAGGTRGEITLDSDIIRTKGSILSDTDGSQDLGESATRFGNAYTYNVNTEEIEYFYTGGPTSIGRTQVNDTFLDADLSFRQFGNTGGKTYGMAIQATNAMIINTADGSQANTITIRSANNLAGDGAPLEINSGSSDGGGNGGTLILSAGQGTGGSISGELNMSSGAVSNTGDSGNVLLYSGSSGGTGNTGNVLISSGTGSSSTGNIDLATGISTGSGQTGTVSLSTGNSAGGISGVIQFFTGSADTNSGEITFETGPAGGNSGTVVLKTGTAGGTRGNIIVDTPALIPHVDNGASFGTTVNKISEVFSWGLNSYNHTSWDYDDGPSGAMLGNLAPNESVNGLSGSMGLIAHNTAVGTTPDYGFVIGTGNSVAGGILIATDNKTGADSGNIDLITGTSDQTRGTINLDADHMTLLSSAALRLENDYVDFYWATPQVALVADSAVPNDNGNFFIGSTDVTTATSHSVTIFSGSATASGGSTGLVQLASGYVTAGSGNSGGIEIFSGDTVDGNTGSVILSAGVVTGTGTRGFIGLAGDRAVVYNSGGSETIHLKAEYNDTQDWGDTLPAIIAPSTVGNNSGAFLLATGDQATDTRTHELDLRSGFNTSTSTAGNKTGGVYLHSGNATDGVGNSGTAQLYTGSSAGGNSGNVFIGTGTAAAGNSGNITLQAGTAGTTRGYIEFSALVAVLPTGTTDPSTSYPNGSTYYNTSDNTLRILNGGTWRSVLLV